MCLLYNRIDKLTLISNIFLSESGKKILGTKEKIKKERRSIALAKNTHFFGLFTLNFINGAKNFVIFMPFLPSFAGLFFVKKTEIR